MPTPLPPEDAVTKTLREHLWENTDVGVQAAAIVEGWDEQGGDIEYPTVGLDASIVGDREVTQPGIISQTDVNPGDPDDPNVIVKVAVATLAIPIKVNVWARSHAQRSQVNRAIDDALQANVLESGSSLLLSAPLYFDRCIKYRRSGITRHTDTAGAVGRSEFRSEFELLAELTEVVEVPAVKMLQLHLDWSVLEGAGDDFPDDPQERQTIFEP